MLEGISKYEMVRDLYYILYIFILLGNISILNI